MQCGQCPFSSVFAHKAGVLVGVSEKSNILVMSHVLDVTSVAMKCRLSPAS